MWQRRWFVLSGDRLQYFNSPGDVGGGDAKWTLELSALGASTSDGPADQADAAQHPDGGRDPDGCRGGQRLDLAARRGPGVDVHFRLQVDDASAEEADAQFTIT